MKAPSLRPQLRLSCSSLTGCAGGGSSVINHFDPRSRKDSAGQGSFSQLDCHSSPHVSTLFKSGSCRSLRDQRSEGERDSMSGYDVFDNQSGPGSPEEEKIKLKLRFFFLNPLEKYWATRRLPWKLLLQILKVLIVTAQLWIFAGYRSGHTSYLNNQAISLEHILIKNWDQAREIKAYPPATGKLAIYSKSDFFKFIDYAVHGWSNIEKDSFGPFYRNSSLGFCVKYLLEANVTRDLTISLNTMLVESCIHLDVEELDLFTNTENWLKVNNFSVPWHGMERFYLNCTLSSTTSINNRGQNPSKDCFQFETSLQFDNFDHDGQVPVHLETKPIRRHCSFPITDNSSPIISKSSILNILVIILCLCSLFLCLRSLFRAELLKYETEIILKRHFGWLLNRSEKMEFLNLWYILICINDCLIIIGSAFKILLEVKSTQEYYWDVCSLTLGTGNLLAWFGLLRYLGFFQTYNVLILTMKGAAPNMSRFLLCAALLYTGFVFAGWSVLGPYNFKFASLMSTSECLFSLINGDDMFATFNFLHYQESALIWVYSRVYLYTFICVFIYLVLSLFISIIMDTYEIIKICYSHGFQPSCSSFAPKEMLVTSVLVCTVVSLLLPGSVVCLGVLGTIITIRATRNCDV